MARHRILIIGAPASGRGWLAERIEALTGIPAERVGSSTTAPAAREWVRLASRADEVAVMLDASELVVLVHAPAWLRYCRLLLRRRGDPRSGGGLRAALGATRVWRVKEFPDIERLLGKARRRTLHCRSSDDVRSVLECVFGLDGRAPAESRERPAS